MKTFLGVVLAASLSLASPIFAQDLSTSNTSNAAATANQLANSSNQGVQAVVQSYGADRQHVEYRGQVPLSQSGYGSFSQDNCMNAVSTGITTLLVSGQHSRPVADVNCQHIVRAKNYGQQSLQAWNEGKRDQAEDLRAMSIWTACQADEDELRMCIRMGKIAYVDPDHPNIHETIPRVYYSDMHITGPNASYRSEEISTIQPRPQEQSPTTASTDAKQPEWRVAQASGAAGR